MLSALLLSAGRVSLLSLRLVSLLALLFAADLLLAHLAHYARICALASEHTVSVCNTAANQCSTHDTQSSLQQVRTYSHGNRNLLIRNLLSNNLQRLKTFYHYQI